MKVTDCAVTRAVKPVIAGLLLLTLWPALSPAQNAAKTQAKKPSAKVSQSAKKPAGKGAIVTNPTTKSPAAKAKNDKPLPTAPKASNVNVAKVDPATENRAKLAAAKIDSLVEANYQQHSVQPNDLTTDEQFVRRVYLDIAGTIPTKAQTAAFLDSKNAEKRSDLIDQLLNSPGYASHSFNYWANVLRLVDFPEPAIPAAPYIDWIKRSIRENKPYDVWVREMLTAEGKIWDNPAAGYELRDSGMPLDHMNNTVRIFLGTQIGCAQCHDHPFDHWKQKEFYEMAAFTFGVRTRQGPPRAGGGNPVEKLRQELLKEKGGNGAIQLVRANTHAVANAPNLALKLPSDYQYDDGKPNQVVKPKAIFGEATVSPGEPPRVTFAHWLTAKENPRFAKAIANRLWKRALGVGLIEPVDDIRDESKPENPELLDYLTTIVVKTDFDLKEYQRIIYNTKTYQRQASVQEVGGGEVYHFPGPVLRRMTAEQVWDSLLTLAIYNPDNIRRPSMDGVAQAANLDLANVSAKQVVEHWDKFNEKYGKKSIQNLRQQYLYKAQFLARASEQPMPAPPGHFLREFGQGDREQIEGASTDGNVPQILTMFNGPVTHMMLEKGSVIYDDIVRSKSTNDGIDAIFLSLLSRKPTADARKIALAEIKKDGAAGYGDVIWSLLNTREFLFIQ
jgi:hypothetical protein